MKNVSHQRLTKENFGQAVKNAISLCESLRDSNRNPPINSALNYELEIALKALLLIESELQGQPSRPRNQRSSLFSRFVVDEGEKMTLSTELREYIMKIEDFYSRSM